MSKLPDGLKEVKCANPSCGTKPSHMGSMLNHGKHSTIKVLKTYEGKAWCSVVCKELSEVGE